jgi:undecaprenyl-diphosphatase
MRVPWVCCLSVLLLCGGLLAMSTWQVLIRGALVRWDEDLGVAMRHTAPSRPFAEALSDVGNMQIALPLLAAAIVLSLLRWRGRDWRPVLCYAAAMVVMAPAVTVLKAWTDRTGPLGGGGFYPSGHAATTTVALGGALLLLHVGFSRLARLCAWGIGALLVLGNGLGLVWRGYHWPLDVVASWCLSVLLLFSAYAVGRRVSAAGRGCG